VYLRVDGTFVTGEAASLRAVSSPDRVSREFKRRLGNPTPVILGGQPHTVTALLGTLLRDVVHKVIETEGEPPDRVVLTHPANWGPFRRALFEEVPQHAGLDNPPMVTEPEAAAAHYAASRLLTDGQTVAVYDLGGGTFDATVLRKLPGGVEILGTPEGIERLGGVDFDEAILSYVDYTSDGALSELDMRDPQIIVALARLRQDCILAKEALSVDTETILPVLLPGRHFDVRITRSDFEDMVRAPIESTIGALSRTLHSAQVQPTDLSAVLLVGGSSRIPLIARMVSAELGCQTLVDIHPKYAVALGAATLAVQEAPTPTAPTPTVPANTIFGTPHQQLAPAANAPVSASPKTPLHDPNVPPPPDVGSFTEWETQRRTTPGDEVSNERRPRRPRLPLATALVIAVVATTCGLYLLLKPSNVNPGTGTARLTLSKSQVALGDSYFATASGFSPGENLRFFWTGQTAGQTNGVMGVFPADSNGSTSHGPIIERDPLGNYTITVTGLTSKRTASAGLEVVPPGS
jgi:actin-like ATPase involved in cell morphogenesis